MHELSSIQPYLDNDDPVIQSLALEAAVRIDPEFVADHISKLQLWTESLILKQTIEEISAGYEKTETPAEP
jgi:hypothetical protein